MSTKNLDFICNYNRYYIYQPNGYPTLFSAIKIPVDNRCNNVYLFSGRPVVVNKYHLLNCDFCGFSQRNLTKELYIKVNSTVVCGEPSQNLNIIVIDGIIEGISPIWPESCFEVMSDNMRYQVMARGDMACRNHIFLHIGQRIIVQGAYGFMRKKSYARCQYCGGVFSYIHTSHYIQASSSYIVIEKEM